MQLLAADFSCASWLDIILCQRSTALEQVPGGYLLRTADLELKFMTAFRTPEVIHCSCRHAILPPSALLQTLTPRHVHSNVPTAYPPLSRPQSRGKCLLLC